MFKRGEGLELKWIRFKRSRPRRADAGKKFAQLSSIISGRRGQRPFYRRVGGAIIPTAALTFTFLVRLSAAMISA